MPKGGRRPGAGRKVVSEEERRIQVCVSIAPESRERLKQIADWDKTKTGRVLDRLIETEFVSRNGKE